MGTLKYYDTNSGTWKHLAQGPKGETGEPGTQTSIVGISGTTAQFNTANTDGDFATIAGTETLTNKTLTDPKINDIIEATADTGIGADGVLLKDSNVHAQNVYLDYIGGNLDPNVTFDINGDFLGTLTVNSVPVATTTSVQTLTNKRITPRSVSDPNFGAGATATINSDITDRFTITSQSVNLTFAAPSGTPTDGQKLLIRITDDGTSRTLTWNAIFRAVGATIPPATVADKTMYIGSIYNSALTKWDVVAVSVEA